jgi:hypothetical protein
MVIVANEPPYLVCIGNQWPVASSQFPVKNHRLLATDNREISFRLPFPSPRREAQEELNTKNSRQLSAISQKQNPITAC